MESANLGKRCKSQFKELTLPWRPEAGGHLRIFGVGMRRPGLQIDTPF